MKSFVKSKAFWLGVAMVVGAIAEYVNGLPVGVATAQLVSGILTIVVRFLTNTAVAGTPGAKAIKK